MATSSAPPSARTAREAVDAAEVDQAIARVLAAEQAARAAVRTCAAQAEDLLRAAQNDARRIAERSAARGVRIQQAAGALRAARIAPLEAQLAAVQAQPQIEAADLARLPAATARLAAELVGLDRADTPQAPPA